MGPGAKIHQNNTLSFGLNPFVSSKTNVRTKPICLSTSKKVIDIKCQNDPQSLIQASILGSRRGTLFKPSFKNPYFNNSTITPKIVGRTSVKVMATNP